MSSKIATIELGIKNLIQNIGMAYAPTIASINALQKYIAETPSFTGFPSITFGHEEGKLSHSTESALYIDTFFRFVIAYQSHKNEESGRHALYPTFEELLGLLQWQTFNGNCTGLRYLKHMHVMMEATRDSVNLGLLMYQIEYVTNIGIELIEVDTSVDLEEVRTRYKLDNTHLISDIDDITDLT